MRFLKNLPAPAFLPVIVLVLFAQINKAGAQTNVLNYQINLTIKNLAAKSIVGSTKITFLSPTPTTSISFDFLEFNIEKVLYKNEMQHFVKTDSTIVISFNNTIQPTDTHEVTIYYNGLPQSDPTWGGFYFIGNYAFNMGVAFSNVPHNFGRCWFPCIDNFTDRATYEFKITTDSGFAAVCNGLLLSVNQCATDSVVWHWKLLENIPTYLANVAVGRYIFLTDEYVSNGKIIPILIAVEPKDSARAAASLINLKPALQCFESKYGPYPFSRIGYVAVPFNAGAMEHATNISYPIYALDGTLNFETLMAHELSHMWFGNLATCATSEDMWLNEGWASFCEAEFLDCLYGKSSYYNQLNGNAFESFRFAHARDNGFIAISGVNNQNTYGTHVYKKGSLAAHNIKILMGDSAFYAASKSYLKEFAFKHVSSADLLNHFSKFTNANLTDYFNRWIFDKGNYNVVLNKLNISGQELTIGLVQQIKHAQTKLQSVPILATVYSTNGKTQQFNWVINSDTFVRTVRFEPNFTPAFVTINHDNGFYLSKTTELQTIKGTGVRNFNNVLFTLTSRTNPDSAQVMVEHNFTGPFFWEIDLPDIRLSSERYWRIDGNWNNFSATAFFNYDGSKPANKASGYLDNDFALYTHTEDSLVLLYRPNPQSKWLLHTDHTFQPGPSKTDFVGRFWVNNLQKGEYAFGIKDATASINATKAIPFKIYPNPTKDLLFVEGNKIQNSSFTIKNLAGKLLLNGEITNNGINVKSLPAGVYLLTITTEKDSIILRFIKE